VKSGAVAVLVAIALSCTGRTAIRTAPKILRTQPTKLDCAVPVTLAGELQVTHCKVCGESREHGTEDPIFLEGSLELPDFATDATVFQNGWSARYIHDDHRVTAVASAVQDIVRQGRTLRWNSVGLLRDQNFDDAYEYCSTYTVLAWNRNALGVAVDHSPGSSGSELIAGDATVKSDRAQDSALVDMRLSRPHPAQPVLLPQRVAAILPRGFQFFWTSQDVIPFPSACFFQGADDVLSECQRDDNDLLQLAFYQDHGEGFRSPSPVASSAVDTRRVGWVTYGILKDNDTRRDYEFKSLASTFGGVDVGVIEPPFSITPRNDLRGCISTREPTSEEVVIENVPFRTAIPVLAGWDLSYACRDHHVKEVGVSIDEFSYRLDPLAQTGTLRYRVSRVLRDDGNADFAFDHVVNVLGIGPLTQLVHPEGPVD
jgi:hypothetical protein